MHLLHNNSLYFTHRHHTITADTVHRYHTITVDSQIKTTKFFQIFSLIIQTQTNGQIDINFSSNTKKLGLSWGDSQPGANQPSSKHKLTIIYSFFEAQPPYTQVCLFVCLPVCLTACLSVPVSFWRGFIDNIYIQYRRVFNNYPGRKKEQYHTQTIQLG